jgi:Ferredoxin
MEVFIMTVSKLDQIRKENMSKLKIRKNQDGRKIVIGMGECGMKVGAREVMLNFLKEFKENNIDDVSVILTNCEEKCDFEPIVHVYDKDGTKTSYVNVTPEMAKEIVDEHIINGGIIKKYAVLQNVG